MIVAISNTDQWIGSLLLVIPIALVIQASWPRSTRDQKTTGKRSAALAAMARLSEPKENAR